MNVCPLSCGIRLIRYLRTDASEGKHTHPCAPSEREMYVDLLGGILRWFVRKGYGTFCPNHRKFTMHGKALECTRADREEEFMLEGRRGGLVEKSLHVYD